MTWSGAGNGATNGTRTRDIQDHNLALYQLSYGRRRGARSYARGRHAVNARGASAPRAANAVRIRRSASSSVASCLQKAKRA